MAGITWMIDTDQYTDKQLRRLSEVIYDYDYSISKHIDAELEERKAKEEEAKEIKEKLEKAKVEADKQHHKKKEVGGTPLGRKPKWIPETIRTEAAKYTLRSEFSKKSAGAYSAARGLGMIEELFPVLPNNGK